MIWHTERTANVPAGNIEYQGYQDVVSLPSVDGRMQLRKTFCRGRRPGANPGDSGRRKLERGHHGEDCPLKSPFVQTAAHKPPPARYLYQIPAGTPPPLPPPPSWQRFARRYK